MIVMSHKKDESIVINDDITVVVVDIRGDKVRLGIEAPKEVPFHRREVYDAIKRYQQQEALASAITPRPTTIKLSGRCAQLVDGLRKETTLSQEQAIERILTELEHAGVKTLDEVGPRLRMGSA